MMGLAQHFLQCQQFRPANGRSYHVGQSLGIEMCRQLRGRAIDDPGAEALFIAQHRRGWGLELPHNAEPRQYPQEVIGRVDLPPPKALPYAALASVVLLCQPSPIVNSANSQLLRESSPVTYRRLPLTCASELIENVA